MGLLLTEYFFNRKTNNSFNSQIQSYEKDVFNVGGCNDVYYDNDCSKCN